MSRSSERFLRSRRTDILKAWVGLSVLAALLAYQLFDFRTAFSDFDTWWAFFPPSFAGDDYIAATLDAEHIKDWHIYYRSIAALTAARRIAGGPPSEVHAPHALHLLWSSDPDATGDYENPAFRDTALESWSAGALTWSAYDPVIDDVFIDEWRAHGRVQDLAWSVAAVTPDETESELVLHTDRERSVVYVVPLSMSPTFRDAP